MAVDCAHLHDFGTSHLGHDIPHFGHHDLGHGHYDQDYAFNHHTFEPTNVSADHLAVFPGHDGHGVFHHEVRDVDQFSHHGPVSFMSFGPGGGNNGFQIHVDPHSASLGGQGCITANHGATQICAGGSITKTFGSQSGPQFSGGLNITHNIH